MIKENSKNQKSKGNEKNTIYYSNIVKLFFSGFCMLSEIMLQFSWILLLCFYSYARILHQK